MTTERKKPLPYYRWYLRDHRAHRLGRTLNCFEEGMLRRLLDEQWEEGAIPDDPAQLATIVGEPIGVVSQAWQKLAQFFEPMPGMDGLYVRNRRLESERTEADALRAKRSVAGKMGGRPKANESKSFRHELLLDLDGAKALPDGAMGKHPKANESNGKHPAQESSSSSRAEQSSRARQIDRCICGGESGMHTVQCPIAKFAAFGAQPEERHA